MWEDTIIAVSTPLGQGGLGIVRLSGKNALGIARKIFRPRTKVSEFPPRRMILGSLYNPEQRACFDEVLLTYFPEAGSYTREPMVELSCHGSPVILEEAVRLGIQAGARHADPGEFTLRAYLKGRIDILQAEAIDRLIRAASIDEAKLSFSQLEGRLSLRFSQLRAKIIHLLSQVEARIEFPDEGLRISPRQIARSIESAAKKVRNLIDSFDIGKALSEGITLAIAGRPNVGKSTLFNRLIDEDRAIVTPYPGTTRDYLKERIQINGTTFSFIDTAGLDTVAHPVEREGIRRGAAVTAAADGVLLIVDGSRPLSRRDLELTRRIREKKLLLLINKIDLPRKTGIQDLDSLDPSPPYLEISALKGTNLPQLKATLVEMFAPRMKKNEEVILHLRQKLLLEDILAGLEKGSQLLKVGQPEEIFVEEIRKVVPMIGRLTGEIRNDEVIKEIFGRFCVGK